MTHILIADDHRVVAEGIAALLDSEQDIHVDGIASAVSEALMLVGHLRPQLLLLDVGLPDGDGIDAIPQLLAACPSMRIVVLTMYAEAAVVHRAMQAGAHGFLLKSADADELARAVHTVAAGETFVCEAAQALIDVEAEAPPVLTVREREILQLIVQGCPQKEIADRLCLAFETVHSYTKYIRKKLNCPNTATLVRKAIEQHLV